MTEYDSGTDRSNVRVKERDIHLSGGLARKVDELDGEPTEHVERALRQYLDE